MEWEQLTPDDDNDGKRKVIEGLSQLGVETPRSSSSSAMTRKGN